MTKNEGRLIFFTGSECPHCHDSLPLIAKLEKEEKIKIITLEVWHDAKNASILEKIDNGKCGGVPFFYNTKTKKWLCGSCDYPIFKKWALGK